MAEAVTDAQRAAAPPTPWHARGRSALRGAGRALRGWLDDAGLPGLAAALLLPALLLALLAWWWPLQHGLAQARADEAQRQGADAHAPSTAPAPARPAAEAQLAAFAGRFPDLRGVAPLLGRLHALAGRRGLHLAQAETRWAQVGSEPFSRYSVVLPVTGDYAQVRGFVTDLLREEPAVALRDISLRRDDAHSAALEARLNLVVFVNEQPQRAGAATPRREAPRPTGPDAAAEPGHD